MSEQGSPPPTGWTQPSSPPVGPAWYPPAPVPPRPAGRLRIGVAALLTGALIGGGAGAGVATILHDNPSGTAAGSTSAPAQNVIINDPETATAVTAAAAKAFPSVVTVYVTGPAGSGSGSGVILTEDGYVLTNEHVASLNGTGSTAVQVRTADGELYDATVVGSEPTYDLAVLRLTDASDLTPASFADSSDVQVGDLAVAIGAPLGLSGTVTDGIISATSRAVTTASTQNDATVIDALQTDAAINPGNSGGALVNAAGEVIGINTAIATVASGGPGQPTQSGNIGVGFAIPSNTAVRIAEEIMETGSATTTYLGVGAQTATSAGNDAIGTGAQIVAVEPGSPAAEAGLRAGDIVTAVGDRPVLTSTDLTAAVRNAAPGDEVTLSIRRGGETGTVEVTLGTAGG